MVPVLVDVGAYEKLQPLLSRYSSSCWEKGVDAWIPLALCLENRLDGSAYCTTVSSGWWQSSPYNLVTCVSQISWLSALSQTFRVSILLPKSLSGLISHDFSSYVLCPSNGILNVGHVDPLPHCHCAFPCSLPHSWMPPYPPVPPTRFPCIILLLRALRVMKTSRFCPNLWSSLVWIFAHVVHSSWVSPFPPHFSSLCSTDFFLSLSGKNDLSSVDRTPTPAVNFKVGISTLSLVLCIYFTPQSIQRSCHILCVLYPRVICML